MTDNENNAPQPAEVEEEQYAEDVYADEEDDKLTGPILERPNHEDDPDEELTDDDFEEFDN